MKKLFLLLFTFNFLFINPYSQEEVFNIKKYMKTSGDITFFSQTCLNSGKKIKNSFSSDIEIEGFIHKNLSFFVHFENGKGIGLEKINEMTSFSVNEDVNDTNYNFKITELYTNIKFNKKISLCFGRLDPTSYIDENNFANDETTQFFSTVFKYNPTIDMPENSTGGNLSFSLTESINLSTTLLSVENTKMSKFNSFYYSVEMTKNMKNINLRGYFWKNGGENSKGIGINSDLDFKNFGLFIRYGKNYNSKNPISAFISGGITLKGILWKRKKDEMGIGFGNGFVDKSSSEKIIETYYKIKITKNLYLSFDQEIIFNPIIDNSNKKLFITGIRTYVSF